MPLKNIFEKINTQLQGKGLIVKTGAIVDATVTDSPRKPKGKTTYAVADDRKEEERSQEETKEEALQNIREAIDLYLEPESTELAGDQELV